MRRRAALVGHVHDVDLRRALEELAAEVRRRAVARRSEVQLAGPAFASAISSFTDFAGSDGCTTSTIGAADDERSPARNRCSGSYGELRVEARIDRERRRTPISSV